MTTTWSLLVSVALLALNAFFVAAEFALVASKRHRFEQAAAEGSRRARAALAGVRELSLMLAGAQLGITLCTLALGALAKPAVAHVLDPLLEATGLPSEVAYLIAVILAVCVVSLLHVVVGEMAPKSWAISHPETSALRLAVPFRWFTRLFRPLLLVLNAMANACLRLVKVTPQDELAQAHGPEELRMLIASSREHGTLEAAEHDLLTAMLAVQNTTIGQIMTPLEQVATVAAGATSSEIERTSRDTGRSRLAVIRPDGRIRGIVHVRDAFHATTVGQPGSAATLMTEAFPLPTTTPVAAAIRMMREHRCQLAVVTAAGAGAGPDGTTVGIVALEDLLEEVIGEFDDETDPVITAAEQTKRPATSTSNGAAAGPTPSTTSSSAVPTEREPS